jgi:hypothetical protein
MRTLAAMPQSSIGEPKALLAIFYDFPRQTRLAGTLPAGVYFLSFSYQSRFAKLFSQS